MTGVLLMALCFLIGLAVIPAVQALPGGRWKVRQKVINFTYTETRRRAKGTQLYLQKGFTRIPIEPPNEKLCIAIGSDDYADKMSGYREHARQAASDLNVDQKMLRR